MFVKLTGPPEPTLFYFCGESRFSRQKNATRKAGTLRSTIFYCVALYFIRTDRSEIFSSFMRSEPLRTGQTSNASARRGFNFSDNAGPAAKTDAYLNTERPSGVLRLNRKQTQMRIVVSPGPRRDLMINRPCFSCNEDINRIGFIRAR